MPNATTAIETKAPADPPRVVVIGAGFAGLSAVRRLRREHIKITLIDRANHHLFQPLLYQVATAALNPSDIAYPIRRIVRNWPNVEVVMANVQAIDSQRREVLTDHGAFAFDFLIVAAGACDSYFGNDAWRRNAPGLKAIDDALDIRGRVLTAFERAEIEPDPARRRAWLTFVIVGGGPTGVELAGTLAEVSRKTLARDFRRIDPSLARVLLVEGGNHVLNAYPESLSRSARDQLEGLGVTVWTDRRVTAIDDEGVSLGPERIAAHTVLWAAGVAASPLGKALGVPLDRSGRVRVEPDLSIPGHPNIFVAGDLMSIESDGKPVPGIAPAATQAGRAAAENIARTLVGRERRAFDYHDKGMMATIGRAKAVADLKGWKFSGLPAWLLWLFVHIFFLVGFRNRILVMIQWAWSYATYDRGARLITARPGDEAPMRVPTPGEADADSRPRVSIGVADGPR